MQLHLTMMSADNTAGGLSILAACTAEGRDTRAVNVGRHCRAPFLTADIDGRQGEPTADREDYLTGR